MDGKTESFSICSACFGNSSTVLSLFINAVCN